MHFTGFLLVLAVFWFGTPTSSHANTKSWTWWPKNWENMSFEPYIGGEKIIQRSLWDNDEWTPEKWINDAGDEKRIIHDFYKTKIITNQHTDNDNIPVLEVGETFIQLSNLDRRRVLKFIDHVFDVTAEKDGMFFVFYTENKHKPLGIYNKYGFQSY